MRYLSIFLPLALIVSCGGAPHATLQDARNVLAASDKGLSDVVPAIAVACRVVPAQCPRLEADLKVAQDSVEALRAVSVAGDALDSAVHDVGVSLRTLIIDLQAAKAAQGG